MSVAIEDIQTKQDLDAMIQRSVDRRPSTAGSMRGTGTVTFTASVTSATATIKHGFAVTPTSVQLTAWSGAAFCFMQLVSKDQANIVVQGHDVDGTARTGTNNFDWVAYA